MHLVEARDEVGGRVTFESSLPGLAEWARVRDYRQTQIAKMKNVEVHTGSALAAQDVLDYGAETVVIATGASWRRDGVAYTNAHAIPGCDGNRVYTPDDIMNGKKLEGPIVIFDDDHYYIGGVIAEKMRAEGHEVTIVTPLMRTQAIFALLLNYAINRRLESFEARVVGGILVSMTGAVLIVI